MINRISSYSKENGGRVLVLFLLFLLALYQLYSSGINGMVVICLIPLLILGLFFFFQHKMTLFWIIFVINYIIMGINRYFNVPVPITTLTITPQILLIILYVFDIRYNYKATFSNAMIFGITIWTLYIILQIFNQTCQLPISYGDWGRNFLFYGLIFYISYSVVALSIRTPNKIMWLLRLWAFFSIAAFYWAWRQKTFGWDDAEWGFLMGGGARTHLIGGSIRYFSFFTDAANFGCCMGASAVAFYSFFLKTKIKKDKILFLITALACTWGFFLSGTRAGLFCFLVGMALYVILSKSFKIAVPVGIIGTIFFIILAFTNIGQGNMQIRRMRSAFNENDASSNVRDINKAALKKYLRDAPFGLGFNINENEIPANHKYKVVVQTANDSTYVFFWQRVGIVGAILFAIMNGLILLGGSIITLFRLKNKTCINISAGFCCAFLAIQAGGYANGILLQFPNLFLFYGGMAIVYLLPNIEKEYEAYENRLYLEQEQRKRIKLEKKKLSRV